MYTSGHMTKAELEELNNLQNTEEYMYSDLALERYNELRKKYEQSFSKHKEYLSNGSKARTVPLQRGPVA